VPGREWQNRAMTRRYDAADPSAPVLGFGHGAGAGLEHPWMVRVGQGLAARGVHVVTFNFPYKTAGRSVPDPGPVLESAFADVWKSAGARFAGGKSMGGRIGSQAAARKLFDPAPAGLVFFGYPLHPPGRPSQRRDRHLPDVGCPMLFLHGTRDQFGSPDEMTTLAASLGSSATLELIDGGDHSLVRPKREDPGGSALEHAMDVAAKWMVEIATKSP
jgi:predicted alpha/beta-hydrolase family hydrolase